MLPYIVDWLGLLGRWLHFIVGIAWIGSSFYFVWLDNHLLPPKRTEDDERGVAGEVWSVHGGGFYHAQKYRSAPPVLPEHLHWFKWEAYATWLTGMFLLGLIYWYGAEIYLIDSAIFPLSKLSAIVIAIGFLAGSWIVYDLLCKSALGRNDTQLALALLALIFPFAWGLCQLFSGRGAFIHFGAALGTIMVANVFFVIIPGQKQLVSATQRGEAPDPSWGIKGKQRSVHNTYFTLPVLFTMISHHYAMTYAPSYNWLVLVAVCVAGALIRVFFVARHTGHASPWPLLTAIVLLAGVAAVLAPATGKPAAQAVTTAEVQEIIERRCTTCHAQSPTFAAYAAAPGGLLLEDISQIRTAAPRIHDQTVISRVMPIGNLTKMTEDERTSIDAWYQAIQEEAM